VASHAAHCRRPRWSVDSDVMSGGARG
jgi:hypothetical protein